MGQPKIKRRHIFEESLAESDYSQPLPGAPGLDFQAWETTRAFCLLL
jgi:hypothetical protein